MKGREKVKRGRGRGKGEGREGKGSRRKKEEARGDDIVARSMVVGSVAEFARAQQT